jgi:hypothetical protein
MAVRYYDIVKARHTTIPVYTRVTRDDFQKAQWQKVPRLIIYPNKRWHWATIPFADGTHSAECYLWCLHDHVYDIYCKVKVIGHIPADIVPTENHK